MSYSFVGSYLNEICLNNDKLMSLRNVENEAILRLFIVMHVKSEKWYCFLAFFFLIKFQKKKKNKRKWKMPSWCARAWENLVWCICCINSLGYGIRSIQSTLVSDLISLLCTHSKPDNGLCYGLYTRKSDCVVVYSTRHFLLPSWKCVACVKSGGRYHIHR